MATFHILQHLKLGFAILALGTFFTTGEAIVPDLKLPLEGFIDLGLLNRLEFMD